MQKRLGPFSLIKKLGEGGMSEVYLAHSPWPAHPLVALKILRNQATASAEFHTRFQHEMALAARLRHKNVVTALDIGVIGGRFYVASEVVVGADARHLAKHLADRRVGMPGPIAVWFLAELLSGLSYIHHAADKTGPLRLIHRDVTPGNVLIDDRGFVKLNDFGFAKSTLSEDGLTESSTVLGTPSYIAPETVAGYPPSQAMDVYGAGAVMYTLLTGIPPYWGNVNDVFIKILEQPPPPLAGLRPDLPPWFIQLVDRLMARDPRRRPHLLGLNAMLLKQAQESYRVAHRWQVRAWLKSVQGAVMAQRAADIQAAEQASTHPIDDERQNPPTDIGERDPLWSLEANPNETTQLNQPKGMVAVRASSYEWSKSPPVVFPPEWNRHGPSTPSDRSQKTQWLHDEDLIPAPRTPVSAQEQDTDPTAMLATFPANPRSPFRPWVIVGILIGLSAVLTYATLQFRTHAPHDLQQRYERVQTQASQRKLQGQDIPPEFWQWSSFAATALFQQDDPLAEDLIETLERMMKSPPEPAHAPASNLSDAHPTNIDASKRQSSPSTR